MEHMMVRKATRTMMAVLLGSGLASRAEAQEVSPMGVIPAIEPSRASAIQEAASADGFARSVFNRVTPSFSIAPKVMFRRRGPRGAMVDYAKQTVWLSTDVHDILPSRVRPLWPSPVRLSVGRRGLGSGLPAEYVVGLDLDAARLPGSHPIWMQVKSVLHSLRLPGPAVVVGPAGTRALGLYW